FCLLAIIIGYLIGSLSPSYIFGRLLKNIDIREHGDGNAGTVNTYKVLGFVPAFFTALIDVSKGLLSMFIAKKLGASPICYSLAGLSAIGGHVFPFYLKFKGGQGVATAVGMLLYYLFLILKNGWLTISDLLILTIVVISFSYITRKGEMVGLVVLPLFGVFIFLNSPLDRITVFLGIIIIYIIFIALLNLTKTGFLKLNLDSDTGKHYIPWRLLIRPAAILLVYFHLTQEKKTSLYLVGGVTLFFLLIDTVRLIYSKFNVLLFKTREIFKSKEYKKFSSITLFLIACFLSFLLFERNIASLAVTFIIFGDFFSKYFGMRFGRNKIFEKTLEGSIAFFNACLVGGYVLFHFINFSFSIFIIGALVATMVEILPFGLDDNFSVSIVSGSIMYILKNLFG
ncbi:glycerol-3-phosphate acyltransferase, partial [Candidatus Aminicenantes bacterium AC-335-G13]|nr:glycerol-3-phosphate acyltransferase [Candidatus Aminicenantes bacterium AC-335-G13]